MQTAQRCFPINLCNRSVLVLLESLQGTKYFQREKDLMIGEQPFNPPCDPFLSRHEAGGQAGSNRARLLQSVPQPYKFDVCT